MSPEPDPPTNPLDTPAAPRPAYEKPKQSHSTIARHLTRLRDAASAILALFASHNDQEDAVGAAVAAPTRGPGGELGPIERPKTPLEIRIERHTATIDRAMTAVARLNPDRKSRKELPEDLRGAIARQQRIARDTIDAEVLFWSATIENNPLIRLDETEGSWVRRILELAAVLGCSPDYEENLISLRNWSVNASH